MVVFLYCDPSKLYDLPPSLWTTCPTTMGWNWPASSKALLTKAFSTFAAAWDAHWGKNYLRNRIWFLLSIFKSFSYSNSELPYARHSKLFSPELYKCYFLYIHKQILSKVPTLLHSVRTKRSSGNCYISCFLTDKTALSAIITSGL